MNRYTSRGAALLVIAAGVVLLGWVAVMLSGWPPAPPGEVAPSPTATEDEPAEPPAPKRLVVFGHSMPAGGGASDSSLGYAQVAAEAVGLRLVNHAEGGSIASTAANTMAAASAVKETDIVLIHTGMNDILTRGTQAAEMGREAIDRLLRGTSDAQRRIVELECQPATWEHTPPYDKGSQRAYDEWNAMLRDEAADWVNVTVLDTCATWKPATLVDSTRYHPNDRGHEIIARDVAQSVES